MTALLTRFIDGKSPKGSDKLVTSNDEEVKRLYRKKKLDNDASFKGGTPRIVHYLCMIYKITNHCNLHQT